MSDLRPLGSEKLPVDEKLKRIMEIANYGRTPKSTINENKLNKNVEYLMVADNGVYGVVREGSSYYVQKGINESSLDYIGGMFMKDKNKFSSYSSALKRLELISGQETLNEAKKYVLKTKDAAPVADVPVEDVPAEPVADAPIDDAPIDDLPPADSGMEDEIPSEEPTMEPEGEEEGKRSDYMSEIQKFSGKLGQSLRDVKEKMESDDIKYVINMVLSAVNLDALDEEDKEEIVERFEPKDDFSDEEGMDDIPSEDSMDDEISDEPSDEELDEIMSKLESFIDTDTIVDEDEIPEGDLPESEKVEEKRIEDIADLSVRHEEVSEMEEDVELDLDELKKEINKNVDDTLSKYFK